MLPKTNKSRAVAVMLAVIIAAFVQPNIVAAQQAEEDVVYLKDGSIIRGTIVEQKPGESLAIRTKDGSVFRYQMTQVTKISKEPIIGTKASGPLPGAKEPGTATLLSVVVWGGGQLYAGETNRGLMLLGVGLGSVLVGAALSANSVGVSCDDFSCEDDTNYLPVILGYGVSLGAWIYGIIDADDSVRRMNVKRGFGYDIQNSKVQPVLARSSRDATSVGIRINLH